MWGWSAVRFPSWAAVEIGPMPLEIESTLFAWNDTKNCFKLKAGILNSNLCDDTR